MNVLDRQGGILLDIGCGANKQGPNFVGMDHQPLPGVDIVHNWNDFPWPLPDGSVLTAVASHVVEHVSPVDGHFLRWMDEVWRVLKVGGQISIVTPHGYSPGYLQDPTHCNACNENTWLYFTPDHPLYQFYRPKPWKIDYLSFSVIANIIVVLSKLPEEHDGQDHHNGAGAERDNVPGSAPDSSGA